MKITKPYSILFNAVADALPLIKRGLGKQASELLMQAQKQTEKIFISSAGEQDKGNLAEELGVTKEYIRNALSHQIINEDSLDSPIYDFLILDAYEDEPFFDLLCESCYQAFHTAFKFGFDTRDLMSSQSIALTYKTDENGKVQLIFTPHLKYNVYVITKETQIEVIGDDKIKFSKFKEIERKPLATCTSENLNALRLVGENHHERIINLDNTTAWIRVVAWECTEPIDDEELLLTHYDQMALNQLDNEVVDINWLKQQHWQFD